MEHKSELIKVDTDTLAKACFAWWSNLPAETKNRVWEAGENYRDVLHPEKT
jgi:hypothetical protein